MPDLISYDFLVPPTVLILLSAAAAWLTLWHPRVGVTVGIIITTTLLYLAALPVVAARMLEDVEIATPEKPNFSGAQAIVVLGGGVHRGDGELVPDTLSAWSLQRVYFAAQAYRLLKLKVVKRPATKAREGINPFTGEKMTFKAKPASKKVRALPLKNLKSFVN